MAMTPPAPAAALSGAGAQIPSVELFDADRPGRDGADAAQCVQIRPHSARLHAHRHPRRRQDHDGPHSRPRRQFRGRERPPPDARSRPRRHPRPRHHRGPACRRDGDGRRLQHRHRRHPRDHRFGEVRPGLGAVQGLHHRRSAHALDGGLQRAAEDARRAAALCEVHLRHHRDPQGPGDDPQPLHALRSAPRAARDDDAPIWSRSSARRASTTSPRRWR